MDRPGTKSDHPHPIRSVQDWLASALGISPEDRVATLTSMLQRTAGDTIGYWLQLVLALAIATFGLALGSTAVVIGAMLISPLMQPLVELGMGLAVGSPLLTLRSSVRIAMSVAVVVLGAAAITATLPFHEVTAELAARTSPTILDLFVAGCCALAAVYTVIRNSRDTVSAAAGTAIGISLVPPLCTAGYGLGIGSTAMLRGALLLFTANFTAIITVTAVVVLCLGYGQVDNEPLENEALARPNTRSVARALARISRRVLSGKLGIIARVAFPLILLAVIFVPLQRALADVASEVEVRREVDRVLASIPQSVVRQSIEVRGDAVAIRLFMVGSEEEANALRDRVASRLEAATGRMPYVEVTAVPDAQALDAIAARLQAPPPSPVGPAPPSAEIFVAAIEDALAGAWPAAAGELHQVRITPASPLELEVIHLGPALGTSGEELLARELGRRMRAEFAIVDVALPVAPIVAVDGAHETWLGELVALVATARSVDDIVVCIDVPAPPSAPPPRRGRATPAVDPSATMRRIIAALVDPPRVMTRVGPSWQAVVSSTGCAPQAP